MYASSINKTKVEYMGRTIHSITYLLYKRGLKSQLPLYSS